MTENADPSIDYRALLKRYLAKVGVIEGLYFVQTEKGNILVELEGMVRHHPEPNKEDTQVLSALIEEIHAYKRGERDD